MPQLIIEKGPQQGRAFTLRNNTRQVFGREDSDTVNFGDPRASRRHFCICGSDGDFLLKDENSRHGTYLNGKLIKRAKLNDGDQICAGETWFEFQTRRKIKAALIGRTIGGYQIEKQLGEGGMGKVFLATQLSLNRKVALKFLSIRGEENVERFLREARAAACLNHTAIAQIYDAGADRGYHFYSMEYLPAGSLMQHLREVGKVTPMRAVRMMIDVTRGLEYAESQGIVHRDIKPDNLMLDARGNVKLVDMGLARCSESGNDERITIAGTPQYISPEHAVGEKADKRSDIYSLGCTSYHLLTGEAPFGGKSVEEIIEKQLTEQAAPVKALVQVSSTLSRLIERMMAKNPEERPANAAALLHELEMEQQRRQPGDARKPRTNGPRAKSRERSQRRQCQARHPGFAMAASLAF
ncbi:MAG: FHA domain-containing serine/threonine-protein kinase, partial [Planctomycetota bacterium]|nr:FHA domain-containing serine/threonine-protein kinase [Planctomycetota bacterium]